MKLKIVVAVLITGWSYFGSSTALGLQVHTISRITGNDFLSVFDDSGTRAESSIIPSTGAFASLTTDNDRIFITSSDGGINQFDLEGDLLGGFANVSSSADPLMSSARQILESDALGNVYTTFTGFQSTPRTSFRLAPDGSTSASFAHPDLVFPVGIDADSNGNVFILNSALDGDRLFQFDESGSYIDDFAVPGVTRPSDIAINEVTNELFIGDLGAIRVYDLTSDGPLLVGSLQAARNLDVNDVFVEPSAERILGATFDIFNENNVGFEVSREGELVNTFAVTAGQQNLGVSAIAVISDNTISVPEPTATGLLLIAAISLAAVRVR